MSILRTIAMFVYLFGYMIVHYGVLRRAERALAAGDMDTVEQIINKHIPHWSRGILKVTGARLVVEGQENIPKDGPCVFVGNHRSYYDIPLLLVALDAPHGILAKEELEKIPLLNRWMKLLGCVFVKRDDIRASVKALNDATAIVESGKSFVIFPEGTRYKGEEGGAGEFKAGAFRIAIKTGAPVVPVAISGARGLFEAHGNRATPGSIHIRILPFHRLRLAFRLLRLGLHGLGNVGKIRFQRVGKIASGSFPDSGGNQSTELLVDHFREEVRIDAKLQLPLRNRQRNNTLKVLFIDILIHFFTKYGHRMIPQLRRAPVRTFRCHLCTLSSLPPTSY